MFVIEVRGKWRKKLKVILGHMQNSREVSLGYVSHCLKKKKSQWKYIFLSIYVEMLGRVVNVCKIQGIGLGYGGSQKRVLYLQELG